MKNLLYIIILFSSFNYIAQVNQVGNPSFEIYFNCVGTNYVSIAKYWNSLDSTKLGASGDYNNICYPYVPSNAGGFQYPKTGNAYVRTTLYCTLPTCPYPYQRNYIKNRLLNTLTPGKVYCAKMFVNLTNTSPFASDGIEMHFANSSIDTTSYCMIPLSYLTPQVQNPIGNVIGDTMNWIEVSGTFTATGIEKYLVIGNFRTDAATTKTVTGANAGSSWSEYYIDDVSVIDFNLSAYAGPDKNITLGDSAFIGRPPEIGLECIWSSGTVSIGSGGGIWVKPLALGTYSYVVTQNICGNIKIDTVNVNVGPGFMSENELFSKNIGIYPQPSKDIVNISLNYIYEKGIEILITDLTGKEIEKRELEISQGKTSFSTDNLSNGVYILQIKNSLNQSVIKRLVIAK